MPLGYTKFAALLCLSAALALAAPAFPAQAQSVLHVAAASDLQPVMPALAAAYEKETGVKLQVAFGSSSALATQILNGAPMDLFLAADYTYPEKIVAANLAGDKVPIPYAEGTLVLWARKDANLPAPTIDSLVDPRITRIAVADEFHAPYGRAAYAALRSMKLYDKVQSKLVSAENIAQTAEFVESGNAQIAFLSLTLVSTAHMKQVGTFTRVPKIYPRIRQCGVTLKASPNLAEAHKFMHWLTSDKVQSQLKQFGLDPAQ